MKEKAFLKELGQYVALNICGMIGLACYILADTFFVSKGLGANGLTALNLAIPIYSFVHGSGLMLGADYEIFVMTKTYLQVILLFAPAFISNDSLLCFVRNDGNPKLSMIAMLAGSLSNIVLDYVFIFPLHMGILVLRLMVL